MRKRRREYSRRRMYSNNKYDKNKFARWWESLSLRMRRILAGSVFGLLIFAVIFLMVCGGVYLHDKAVERREQMYAQTSTGQPNGQLGGSLPSGGGTVQVGQQPGPATSTIPIQTASPTSSPEVSASQQPVVTVSPTSAPQQTEVPGQETPMPTSNGHELDDEMVIVIDAGHGGIDGGSSVGDVVEKDINLAVAKEVAKILKEHEGVTVVQTRDSDTFPSLQDRCEIANDAKADYFVSVHCNTYAADSSVRGFEVHYFEESDEGANFAQAISDEMKQYTDMKIRSIKPGQLVVTKYTYCPAILIEMGFLTNDADRTNLSNPDYQKLLAERIAKAVLKKAGL